MADQDTAGTGAKDEGTKEEDQNPFAGFQTEQYKQGEREDAPKGEEQKKEAPAEQKKASAPGSAAKKEEQQPDDEDDDEDDAGADDGAGKPKKPAQKRIGELTRKFREEERLRIAAERRLRELEARGGDDDGESAGKPAGTADKKKAPAADEKKDGEKEPKPEDYEFGELDSRYIRALARYEADQRFAELEAKREERQQQEQLTAQQRAAQEKFQARIEEGEEKYEDFHEKVVLGAEEGTWPLSQVLGELIVESEVGADIAYHLATNPDEAATVYRQSPLEQARYFGKMEAKFSAAPAAASEKEPAKPKTPKAPAPVDTPRGRGGKFQVTADTDDFAAFERVAQEIK